MPKPAISKTADDEAKPKAQFTTAALLAKAEDFMDRLEYSMALRFYRRVAESDPFTTEGLDGAAECLIELGEVEEAIKMLHKSIELNPQSNPQKWLHLAQLTEGTDSLAAYQHGIELLQFGISNTPEEAAGFFRRQLAEAHVGVAELYMTDLCDEPEAEEQCGSHLSAAQEADPSNFEALCVLTNYKMMQQSPEEARAAGLHACGLLRERADADDTELPTWNVRFTLAKVLLELEQYTECVEVLERLVLENDQVMEAWYLLGEALLGEEDPTAPDVVQHAIGLIQKQREEADTPELAAEEEQMSKLLAVIVERIGHPSAAPGDQGHGTAADMDES